MTYEYHKNPSPIHHFVRLQHFLSRLLHHLFKVPIARIQPVIMPLYTTCSFLIPKTAVFTTSSNWCRVSGVTP